MNVCTKFHTVRTHGLGDRGLEDKYLYFAEFQEKWSEILRVKQTLCTCPVVLDITHARIGELGYK